ncbi:ParA family protein [Maridesulfovibrio ferrireducens]|uniref:ParA family protein n=1 Tax=Maridesulfovibrio ferrireducens TaxID=246191 RepID=UPI001A1DA909|nr:ParA family protein [Maridesulfovibrio ferrireducens]MBI9111296.1 ParA family protein [Maridesulfovibrio ferrireducens]
MRRIAVCLSKGGVGKTTTAVNLAHGLARRGKSVVLVDLDTQGQVSRYFGLTPEFCLADVVRNVQLKDCLIQARENLQVIAGGADLAILKEWISNRSMKREMALTELLEPLESMNFDYVIFDTSPGWDVLNVNVFFYVDELLCPVSLMAMSLDGVAEFVQNLEQVQKYRPDLMIDYIVPTFLDRREKQCEEVHDLLKKHFGDKVTMPIPKNVRVSECFGHAKTIYEYAPKCIGAGMYEELACTVDEYVRR